MNPVDYNKAPWIKMTLEELKTPRAGEIVMGPRWWVLTEDNCVVFYKQYYSPQCNPSEAVAKHLWREANLVFVEVAFVPHNCSDYV